MELQSSYLPFVVSFILFIFMVSKLGKKSKLPPGPWRLPIIGNLHQMAGSQPPHQVLREFAKRHGPLMYLQLGEVPTIVVSSAEYAKEVMQTHDIVFASRPKLDAVKILTYYHTSITFAPYGEYWRQLRKICVSELLSTRRVASLGTIREQEVSKIIKWVYSKTGSPINLTENIFSSTYASVSRMLFREIAEEKDAFISIMKESSRLAAGFNAKDTFPSFKLFHFISSFSCDVEKVHEKSDKILRDIIYKRIKSKAELTTRMKEEEDEDLVDVLLKFHEPDAGFSLTMDNIKAIIKNIFGGGGDTSSATIDWAMVEMIKHPTVMKKAQAEVRQVFNNRLSADLTGISELKYLKLVIRETLRLHPPTPLLLPRENSERCEINGYEIPEKTRVLVNAWAIGRDPEYWGVNAEIFHPERFANNPVDFKGGNFEYIPFGAGRRMCPGMAFGLANVEFLLAQLLFHFDWKLPAGVNPEDLNMVDSFGLSMTRRDHLFLVPTPYHSSSVPNS